jgi:hypothetical protein
MARRAPGLGRQRLTFKLSTCPLERKCIRRLVGLEKYQPENVRPCSSGAFFIGRTPKADGTALSTPSASLSEASGLTLSATRKRHAHKLANEPSTTIQNEQENAVQNENGAKSIRD